MSSDLYRRGFEAYRAAVARDLGCAPGDFESNALVVVTRPATSPEKYISFLATFGTGTVWSVEPAYLDFARSLTFAKHYQAFAPTEVAAPVVAEAERRGEQVRARGPNLGFLLADPPDAPVIPEGLRLVRVDQEWRARYRPGGRFGNALAELDEPPEIVALWQYGLALLDAAGEPAAVAGAYDDRDGFMEIGVDVAKRHRGRGLAPVIVAAMVHSILAQERLPTYYCAPTNIRSQRTAIACGFLPTLSGAVVRRIS